MENILHIFTGYNRCGIGLFVVTAEFCNSLAKADPYGNCDTDFLFYTLSYAVCEGFCITAEKVQGVCYIKV
jgi:hypothetical protein